MNGVTRDVRAGLRQFQRAPLFAAIVVATVAIGVGGATAVFSVLKGVVLTPLSFPDSERVVTLWGQTPSYPRAPLTVGDHNALVEGVRAFSAVSAEWGNSGLLLGQGDAEQVAVGWVTPEYFDVLRIVPEHGRLLRAQDESAVVRDHSLWARRYGSDPSIIGQTIDVGGTLMEVVGILPPGANPNLTTFSGNRASNQVWRLQPREWTQGDDRSVGWLRSSARLGDGVSLAQAQAEVDALMNRINATITDRDGGTDLRINVVPARADLVAGISRTLWTLLAAVIGVLLIAATNVANLMLGRTQSRSDEVAVRAALGGSRFRLFRQFFVESLVLAGAGGILGLAFAWGGMRGLLLVAPSSIPRLDAVSLDPTVLGFALTATAVAALLFGVVPAMRGTGGGAGPVLRERHGTATRHQQRLSRSLVVAEVALALGLLVGTGLLLRSLEGLHGTELGFEKDGVLTFSLEVTSPGETVDEAAALLNDYLGRVGEIPGVVAAGVTNRIPLAGGLFTGSYRSEDMIAAEREALEGSYRYVTPDYFEALGARVVVGRSFDDPDGMEMAVVDRLIAEQLWPGQNPIGRRIEHSAVGVDARIAEVVGVVAPMKHSGVADASPPTIFLPMLAAANQMNFRYMAVRVAGEPLEFVEPIEEALRQVDGNTVMARIRPMSALYATSVAPTRFASQLLAVFGMIALLLATVGLHGVMALSIRRRSREFGIRVALGADHATVLRGVLGSGARLVLLGSVFGVLLSVGVGRFLSSLLYGIEPTDLLSLALATTLIVAVGVLGAYLPARRVLTVDPVTALRRE